MGEQALTETVELAPSKLHNGKGSALTLPQLEALVTLHQLERTQTQIAQAIGCDQATVSRYLKALTPTGNYAGAFLRSKLAELAEKFVESKAKGSDILDVLGRFEAIPAAKDAGRAGLVIQIGIKDSDVSIPLSPIVTRELACGNNG